MQRIMWVLTGAVLGATLMWGSLRYHLLRTDQGFVWAAKRQATLADTYIDVRHWTVADWSKHPDLMLSLNQNGQSSVMGETHVIENTIKDLLQKGK